MRHLFKMHRSRVSFQKDSVSVFHFKAFRFPYFISKCSRLVVSLQNVVGKVLTLILGYSNIQFLKNKTQTKMLIESKIFKPPEQKQEQTIFLAPYLHYISMLEQFFSTSYERSSICTDSCDASRICTDYSHKTHGRYYFFDSEYTNIR